MVRLLLAACLLFASVMAGEAAMLASGSSGCALHPATAMHHHPADHSSKTAGTIQPCCLIVCFAADLPGDAGTVRTASGPAVLPLADEDAPFFAIEPALPPPRL